jgi:hypothetical protein
VAASARAQRSDGTQEDRKCSPDPVSRGVVIRAMFGADASEERIRTTRDRAAA